MLPAPLDVNDISARGSNDDQPERRQPSQGRLAQRYFVGNHDIDITAPIVDLVRSRLGMIHPNARRVRMRQPDPRSDRSVGQEIRFEQASPHLQMSEGDDASAGGQGQRRPREPRLSRPLLATTLPLPAPARRRLRSERYRPHQGMGPTAPQSSSAGSCRDFQGSGWWRAEYTWIDFR